LNQIAQLFSKKSENILSIYFTAGYPHLEDTLKILSALQHNGADMVEIGMPYSDPLADGPVIQTSGMHALENGMTIEKLFGQLQDFKKKSTSVCPLILMGYLNPVLQYGFENFCRDAEECGISGIILPDLPLQEYEKEFKKITEKYSLDVIFLITPQTSESRIRKIDSISSGFIYAVSSSSVTGSSVDITHQEDYFKKLQSMKLKNRVLIGFGIKDKISFETACKYGAGAIIGSAFIKSINGDEKVEVLVKRFLNSILQP
jgi:tryptophan synthase alpha chain